MTKLELLAFFAISTIAPTPEAKKVRGEVYGWDDIKAIKQHINYDFHKVFPKYAIYKPEIIAIRTPLVVNSGVLKINWDSEDIQQWTNQFTIKVDDGITEVLNKKTRMSDKRFKRFVAKTKYSQLVHYAGYHVPLGIVEGGYFHTWLLPLNQEW